MDELRDRLQTARLSNWEHWPTVRELWPWFAALGLVAVLAIPWGIRAEERNLESASRAALTEAGFTVQDIGFTGRQATIRSNLEISDQIAAVAVLAKVGGVSRVTWESADDGYVAPTTTTPPPSTSVSPEPGAAITLSVSEGKITLGGTVPTAQTIKSVSDAAADLWGDAVINQLFVDDTVLAHPWLGNVDKSIAALTLLIDPQLTFDNQGATITGGAINEAVLDRAVAALGEALGPNVPIDNKLSVSSLDLPNIQIIYPGDGTAETSGTVANPAVRRSISVAVAATAEDLETVGAIQVSERTADLYVLRRLPAVITALGGADQWTLQFDGQSIGGTAVGGKAFNGNRVKPTVHLAGLLSVFGSILDADPELTIVLEVHAADREGAVDSLVLAQQRADDIAGAMVLLGIDPQRITSSAGPGEGELLRFMLIPADK